MTATLTSFPSSSTCGRPDERAPWFYLDGEPLGFEAGDANVRRYVGNGPTNATDPTGLLPREDGVWRVSADPNSAISTTPGNGWWHSTKRSAAGKPVQYVNDIPDFSPYRKFHEGQQWLVEITTTGVSDLDLKLATERAQELASMNNLSFPKYGSVEFRNLGGTWHHKALDPDTGTFIMEFVESGVHDVADHTGGFSEYLHWIRQHIQAGSLDTIPDTLHDAVYQTLKKDSLARRVLGAGAADRGAEILKTRIARGNYRVLVNQGGEQVAEFAARKQGGRFVGYLVKTGVRGGLKALPVVTAVWAGGSTYAATGDFGKAAEAAGRDVVMADLVEGGFKLTVVRGSEVIGHALIDPEGYVKQRFAGTPEGQRLFDEYLKDNYADLDDWFAKELETKEELQLPTWTEQLNRSIWSHLPAWLPGNPYSD